MQVLNVICYFFGNPRTSPIVSGLWISVPYLKLSLSLVLITHITCITYITQNFIILYKSGYNLITLSLQPFSALYYGLFYQFLSFSTFLSAYSIFVVLVYTIFPKLLFFSFLFFPLILTNLKSYIAHS